MSCNHKGHGGHAYLLTDHIADATDDGSGGVNVIIFSVYVCEDCSQSERRSVCNVKTMEDLEKLQQEFQKKNASLEVTPEAKNALTS